MSSALDIIKNIIKSNDNKNIIKELSVYLNVARGTVLRWLDLDNVPHQYLFELMKFNNMEIDYSKFSSKEKDQFFTPKNTARYCYKKFKSIMKKNNIDISDYNYIEPSAGSGNFLSVLPKNTISFDIEPKNNKIKKQDYLTWKPTENKKYIVFGNPPFGLRGHLALKFINHSNKFADFVCFILPQLFESDGKGVPRKRITGYNLIHSEKIDSTFIEPNDNELEINCIFQIWAKHYENDKYKLNSTVNKNIKVYSLSDGGTPSSTRNKKMLDKCDIYLPSTCFGKENMKFYNTFEELPGRKGYGIVFLKNKKTNTNKFKKINWGDIAFLSTNSAYNIRTSQIEKQF